MTFKYFTNETFPWFVSTAIGLGIVGISGGLLAILDEPTPLILNGFFAISAREQGLSGDLREGSVAVPMKCDAIPIGLASGDIVMIYSGNEVLLGSAEVRGVNEANRTVTVILDSKDLQKCIGKEVTQIAVLPAIGRKLMVKKVGLNDVRSARTINGTQATVCGFVGG